MAHVALRKICYSKWRVFGTEKFSFFLDGQSLTYSIRSVHNLEESGRPLFLEAEDLILSGDLCAPGKFNAKAYKECG
jgi:hypothetical protein